MRPVVALLCLFCLTIVPATSAAETVLYSQGQLAADQGRYEQRLQELVTRGIWPHLSPAEKQVLATTDLRVPLVGEVRGPLNFYSYNDGRTRFIAMPVAALKLIEDLSTAYAWLWAGNYGLDTIDQYLAMLKYRPGRAFPGGRSLAPLAALQIPANALDDPKVDDLSLRFRNTAWAFILLHEMGHVVLDHRGNAGLTMDEARSREEAADGFALTVLRQSNTVPMGALLYFLASAYYFPNRADFDTDQAWQRFVTEEATHPFTPDRVRALADSLSRGAASLSGTAERESQLTIATRTAAIAEILGDVELQQYIAAKARKNTLADLAPKR